MNQLQLKFEELQLRLQQLSSADISVKKFFAEKDVKLYSSIENIEQAEKDTKLTKRILPTVFVGDLSEESRKSFDPKTPTVRVRIGLDGDAMNINIQLRPSRFVDTSIPRMKKNLEYYGSSFMELGSRSPDYVIYSLDHLTEDFLGRGVYEIALESIGSFSEELDKRGVGYFATGE